MLFAEDLQLVNIGLDWTQAFEVQYQLTSWNKVVLEVAYHRSRWGDALPDMTWNLFVKPDAPVDTVVYQIAASLKSMTNMTIAEGFNSFVIALVDNRPKIAKK